MTGSRKLAWFIVGATAALTGFAIHNGLEGVASMIFSTGIIAGPALYANKQFQERKSLEINNKQEDGKL